MPLETCGWIEACDAPAAGMAAHGIHGVIPICAYHADAFRISLITTFSESE